MQEGTLTSKDGTSLFYRSHGPDNAAHQVLITHGYGEHSGRYVELMEAFASAGIRSLAFDLRGHGRSTGARGHLERFDAYLEDVQAAHAKLGRAEETLLFGHSLGGLVTLHFASRFARTCRALMLGSPYLGRVLEVNPLKLLAAKALGRVTPRLAMPTGIRGEMLTHDPKEMERYDADPLLNKNATVGWFREAEAAMAAAPTAAVRLQMPIHWYHGESDPIASFAVSRAVFAKAESRNKVFVPYAGMRHEPLHEIGKDRVIQQLSSFVIAH